MWLQLYCGASCVVALALWFECLPNFLDDLEQACTNFIS